MKSSNHDTRRWGQVHSTLSLGSALREGTRKGYLQLKNVWRARFAERRTKMAWFPESFSGFQSVYTGRDLVADIMPARQSADVPPATDRDTRGWP
jgi:hypothetical protein